MARDVLRTVAHVDAILMYHRVAAEPQDPWNLCVTPDHFAQHMARLRDGATCVPLSRFERRWPREGLKRLCVSVTFDDGYRDNVLNAVPVLERFDVPATIFIVSGSIGTEREFWWDTLERCLLRPPHLPEDLKLEIPGNAARQWHIDPATDRLDPGWRADFEDPVTQRQALFLELWDVLVRLEEGDRRRCLDFLCEWASVGAQVPRERLPMSLAELLELSRHPLIEIGCHTFRHARLPWFSRAAQWQEIARCKETLEGWIGKPVASFAYPHGSHDSTSEEIVRELGFRVACTSKSQPVTAVEARWNMPRLQVSDQDGESFASWMSGWLPRWQAA